MKQSHDQYIKDTFQHALDGSKFYEETAEITPEQWNSLRKSVFHEVARVYQVPVKMIVGIDPGDPAGDFSPEVTS